ncbi:hypothetical protein [Polymorphospora rubra]|uniref:Uncharacterized protein n=1 Tax=Polymorphospora rubra TaxID=338584 RepID=A0A810MW80_9ACTN|nr:hypothetical protein [Polymorphospora rubra]BCJ64794.1 hypothetical protein Prubr_18150 [Polymorphospora rubra]
MNPDPLMPATHRFPRLAPSDGSSQEQPSHMRPFVLRGAPLGGLREARHRTPATQSRHSEPTTSDGKSPTTKTDTYVTPDD